MFASKKFLKSCFIVMALINLTLFATDDALKFTDSNLDYFLTKNDNGNVGYVVDIKSLKKSIQFGQAPDNKLYSNIIENLSVNSDKELNFSNSRGSKEILLFKNVSKAVVLILTQDSIGTGSVLNDTGEILTNWHVIGNHKKVLVAFKPPVGQSPKESDFIIADVVKINQVSDLALIKIKYKPKQIASIKLGNIDSLDIGVDVHAIGHPEGNLWTYTKGFVSQIRDDYTWQSEKKFKHHADIVIQTQTPINPGNSGGPLLNDNSELVGVNSFKISDGEGLNYAISVSDVKKFLKQQNNVIAENEKSLEQTLSEALNVNIIKVSKIDFYNKGTEKDTAILCDTNNNNKLDIIFVDIDSDGQFEIVMYDDDEDGVSELMTFDSNKNKKPDVYFFDTLKSGKFNILGYDYDEDGNIDKYDKI